MARTGLTSQALPLDDDEYDGEDVVSRLREHELHLPGEGDPLRDIEEPLTDEGDPLRDIEEPLKGDGDP
jgi:hypothetical protein